MLKNFKNSLAVYLIKKIVIFIVFLFFFFLLITFSFEETIELFTGEKIYSYSARVGCFCLLAVYFSFLIRNYKEVHSENEFKFIDSRKKSVENFFNDVKGGDSFYIKKINKNRIVIKRVYYLNDY